MIKLLLSFFVFVFMVGCGSDILGLDGTPSDKLMQKLQAQKLKSDKEVEALESEIAKLQSDMIKYKGDYEEFNNNAILDELDEALSKKDNNSMENK